MLTIVKSIETCYWEAQFLPQIQKCCKVVQHVSPNGILMQKNEFGLTTLDYAGLNDENFTVEFAGHKATKHNKISHNNAELVYMYWRTYWHVVNKSFGA